MGNRIRAGIIGAGMMGQVHVDAVRRLPFAEIAAMTDQNAAVLGSVGEMLQIESLYTDCDEMLDQVHPDVVHICAPNYAHFSLCQKAIERGIHVFCEKPLAITTAEGEILSRLAKEKGIAGAVNFNYRNNGMVQEMRERIVSGDAGKLYFIHGAYLQDWLMYETDYSWRLDREINGPSRAIADIGSHLFDTIQCITDQRIREVYCKIFTAIEERRKPQEISRTFAENHGETVPVKVDTEDGAVIMFRLDNGVLGTVNVSQVSGGHKNALTVEADCANYSMSWAQEDADKLWVASRKEGKQLIYASPATLHGEACEYVNLPEGHAGNWRDALFNSVKHFYKSIVTGSYHDGKCPYTTLEDGARIIRLVEACLKSNDNNEWVIVEERSVEYE